MKHFCIFLLGPLYALFLLSACCNSGSAEAEAAAPDYIVADAYSGATGLGAVPGELPAVDGVVPTGSVATAQYLAEFLQQCGVYYVATVDVDRPKLRPVGLSFAEDGLLWFNLGAHKASWKELERNPNVEICGMNSKTGEVIRVWGKAVMGIDKSAKFLEIAPQLESIYNETTGNKLGTFYLKDAKAEISGRENKIFEF